MKLCSGCKYISNAAISKGQNLWLKCGVVDLQETGMVVLSMRRPEGVAKMSSPKTKLTQGVGDEENVSNLA